MSGKVITVNNITGLPSHLVPMLQQEHGKNIFQSKGTPRYISIVWNIVKEPMFILLAMTCCIYFILRQNSEGFMMVGAILFVTVISLYQEVRSSNALKALQQFTEPKIRVIRDDKEVVIMVEDIVPDDIILLDEGMHIPADALILQENDLTVNESIINGESLPVDKHETPGHNMLYQGTTINTGKCIARVIATGNKTVLGKLGHSVDDYKNPETILQLQVGKFVKRFAAFGIVAFLVIFIMNYLNSKDWITSLLFALTLAMSAIPEEIPVAFSSFMALGAYKMSQLGIITRQPQIVENLGAVSVICLDKTGTITENKMQVHSIYDFENDTLIELNSRTQLQHKEVLYYAVLASEINPFDAMEKAIVDAYHFHTDTKAYQQLKMIFEYPLHGQPPMMTHLYEYGNTKIVSGKGAVERITRVCKLNDQDKEKVKKQAKALASKGFRVIGVASAHYLAATYPMEQDDFDWQFEGLIALNDPPKENMSSVIKQLYDAAISTKILTGDYPETAIHIAEQIGIANYLKCYTGEQVMQMKEEELGLVVKTTNVFARMFPEAKLKVIESLKANGEIVAMTGDGVNDGPALKAADIGIAMGHRGTEIAKSAAGLIITDDDIEKMTTAIHHGRKIFNNLKKAIRYIISIHIPIILLAAVPILLGWAYPNIFTPIHVIFLELIMGPTCSIFYEREPIEENLLQKSPRDRKESLFTKKEILISSIQGCVIAISILILYYFFMTHQYNMETTRTIVFTTLILSNLFLTFVNRSFSKTINYTIKYKNNLAPYIVAISILFLIVLHFIPFVQQLFQLTHLSFPQFFLCLVVAIISVFWFELAKLVKQRSVII
jgi:P-type Ca2+ transporter type 2C